MNKIGLVSISVVSHGQLAMVLDLLEDIQEFCCSTPLEVLLTLNIDEIGDIVPSQYSFPISVIKNTEPKGFGANHNQAFRAASGTFFCVLNPDIRLLADPFPTLLESIKQQSLCLVSPLIVTSAGTIEDSAREFPTFWSLFRKLFFSFEGRWPLDLNSEVNYPDWVAGMFMLFTSASYKEIEGFNTNYFMYYEDVDICRRARNHGYQIGLCTKVKAIHDAQRTSRKNIRFLFWHIKSMLRFLLLSSKNNFS
jgi:GT2 family glycosyltransferase